MALNKTATQQREARNASYAVDGIIPLDESSGEWDCKKIILENSSCFSHALGGVSWNKGFSQILPNGRMPIWSTSIKLTHSVLDY